MKFPITIDMQLTLIIREIVLSRVRLGLLPLWHFYVVGTIILTIWALIVSVSLILASRLRVIIASQPSLTPASTSDFCHRAFLLLADQTVLILNYGRLLLHGGMSGI